VKMNEGSDRIFTITRVTDDETEGETK